MAASPGHWASKYLARTPCFTARRTTIIPSPTRSRPLAAERIQSLASNHGVFRLWTREALFWARQGFELAAPELSKRLPEPWARMGGDWLTLQLKDEQALVSMEKELALFMETERQRSQRTLESAKLVKTIATIIAIIFAVFVLGAIVAAGPEEIPELCCLRRSNTAARLFHTQTPRGGARPCLQAGSPDPALSGSAPHRRDRNSSTWVRWPRG